MASRDTAARVTELVADPPAGDAGESARTDELFNLLYDELRALARVQMRHEREDHTLQPTAVVHEAFVRLVDQQQVTWQGRTHFLAVSARVMRRLLIDHARSRGREKRGGDRRRVLLADDLLVGQPPGLSPEQLLDLDAALDRLSALDPRQARIVELRAYAGLTAAEVAHVLGVSQRTVEGDWTHARAWLRRELGRGSAS